MINQRWVIVGPFIRLSGLEKRCISAASCIGSLHLSSSWEHFLMKVQRRKEREKVYNYTYFWCSWCLPSLNFTQTTHLQIENLVRFKIQFRLTLFHRIRKLHKKKVHIHFRLFNVLGMEVKMFKILPHSNS